MLANSGFWFMIVVLVLQQCFATGLAKKQGAKHHEIESKQDETKSNVHPRHNKASPGIGLKANVPKVVRHEKNEDNGVKTESETTTEIKGPYKTTTTVTKQIKIGKDKKPEVLGQSIEKEITNVFDRKKQHGKYKAKPKHSGLALDIFNPKPKHHGFMFNIFNPFGLGLFGDEPPHVRQCSNKKQCKKPGMYCDKMDNQCRKKVKLDGRCDQAGQCDSTGKEHVACLWGRCALVLKAAGNAGVFCKKDKDCGGEDLHCASQPDISEVSKVCIFKLSEGQTCGQRNMFSFLPLGGETRDLPCRKGLACKELRFAGIPGRKICRRVELSNDEDDDEED